MTDLLPGLEGHEAARRRLATALDRGRLPHALAFVGPTGVGKALAARALARALHCPERPGRGCGACRACRRIDAGHHAGVEWLTPEDGARSIPVETTRRVRNRALRAPLEGPAHVVIVDPAEALTLQSANALLKVLEEPPPGVHFILTCTSLRGLLPTIASRCVPIRFGALPADLVAAILDTQIPDLDPKTRAAALGLCAGRPGEAIRRARDPAVAAQVALFEAAARASAQGPAAVFSGDGGEVWQALSEAAKATKLKGAAGERAAALGLVDLWVLDVRRRCTGEGPLSAGNARRAAAALAVLMDARAALDANAQVRLAVEDLLLRMHEAAGCDAA